METSFVDDLGADSLDAVDIIMRIEDEYNIPEVDEETVMKLHTVGDAYRFILNSYD
jgi:acyl carrier protein